MQQPSQSLLAWMEDGGSFILRLKKRLIQPHVVILRETWLFPEPDEQARLNIRPRHYAFVREVEIRERETPLMYARTVIPVKVLSGPQRLLAHLGTRTLGSVLFSYPQMKRSPFEIKPCRLPQYSAQELWERQSVFTIKQKNIFLREVYLPDLVRIIESR